jgi:anti-sigma factor (TIGR02949 family)
MIFQRLKRALAHVLARPAGHSVRTADTDTQAEHLSCEEALVRIYEYMDGELDHLSTAQVEEHFRVCARCYPHLHLERNFRVRVQTALGRSEVPEDLRERVLDILARDSPAG